VELVVLNVGLDIGVLTQEVFSAFVVMAIWYSPFRLSLLGEFTGGNAAQEHASHDAHGVAVMDAKRKETQPHAPQEVRIVFPVSSLCC
jgi:hypothetical protein